MVGKSESPNLDSYRDRKTESPEDRKSGSPEDGGFVVGKSESPNPDSYRDRKTEVLWSGNLKPRSLFCWFLNCL